MHGLLYVFGLCLRTETDVSAFKQTEVCKCVRVPLQFQCHLSGENPQGPQGAPTSEGHQQGQRTQGNTTQYSDMFT